MLILTHQQKTAFENIVIKREIAHNVLSQCFLLDQISVFPFVHIFDIMRLFAVELEEFKIGIFGKRVNVRDRVLAIPKNILIFSLKEFMENETKKVLNPFPNKPWFLRVSGSISL